VCRVAARCVITDVPNDEALWDGAPEQLVGQAVRLDQFACTPTDAEAPMARPLSVPMELPTLTEAAHVEVLCELLQPLVWVVLTHTTYRSGGRTTCGLLY